jgi:hypothetical protein
MRMISVLLLSISLLTAAFTLPVAAETPVGYVLEIQGNWYLDGNVSNVLSRWQKLLPSHTISIKKPTADDYIVIVDLGGKDIDRRRCDVDDCSRPINLPPAPAPRSLLQVMVQATMDLLFGSPDRYSLHRSRNLGRALSDGVVKLDRGEIDFSPALKNTGRYYLRWRAKPRDGQTGDWSDPISLNFERGGTAVVAAPHLRPGVYEVNLLRNVKGIYEPFASAWVLVSTPSDYESFATSFRQAVELTEQWENTAEPTTARQFLHAHLDYLAGQTHK